MTHTSKARFEGSRFLRLYSIFWNRSPIRVAFFILCPGKDLNLHELPRLLLRQVRLPISPPGLLTFVKSIIHENMVECEHLCRRWSFFTEGNEIYRHNKVYRDVLLNSKVMKKDLLGENTFLVKYKVDNEKLYILWFYGKIVKVWK